MSRTYLSCNLGNFSPPVYQCVGQPCQALQGIPDAPAATCEEGTVLEHGGSCTTKCDYGFVPSDAVLSCNATVLDPANYTCIGTACNAPAGVANAPTMPCLEPPENLTHGSICTTQCLSGFVPSTPVLHCYGGQLRPASFECIEESVWLGYEPSDDTIAQAWAENVAAAGLRDGTALACFKDELSLAIQCVVLLASVTLSPHGHPRPTDRVRLSCSRSLGQGDAAGPVEHTDWATGGGVCPGTPYLGQGSRVLPNRRWEHDVPCSGARLRVAGAGCRSAAEHS